MSKLDDFVAAQCATPIGTYPAPVWKLLEAIETAWVDAEAGIPSESEARRWSPVCDAAMRIVEFGLADEDVA